MIMWTKTRKALYERLAPALKDRVIYNFEVFQSAKFRYYCIMPVFSILVDKKCQFASNPMYASEKYGYHAALRRERNTEDYWKDFYATERDAELKTFYETGYIDVNTVMSEIHLFLNCISTKDCLENGDYMLYMFAILDRRVGKRRIEKLYQGIENEPEWIRKFIRLRAEAEGIIVNRGGME